MTVRVLHVLNHSIPLHSGYTYRTLSILREQRRLGWETFHLTSPKHDAGEGLEETVDGWHFYRTRWTPTHQVPGLNEWGLMKATERRLLAVASQLRPQLLHAHSPVLNALPALRVGRALGIPVVYEIRAFWEDAAVDQGSTTEGSLRYRLTRAMETHALRRVDHAFTICEGLRSDIVARGIPADKVTVIPNAVDIDSFQPGGEADPALKASLGLEGASVVGFIGSFFGYEGLDLLIDALPAMLVRRPEVRLVLIGSGEQDAALRAQAKRMGLQDKIVFTGRVPHAEVQRYYDLLDILAYPRHPMRLTELVTPLKPLEAMAQGRLLVASDVGGHRELIRHGETGQLFKAGDAGALATTVCDLLDARGRWPTIRAAGRRFVEQERNWTASVAHYKPVFERLAKAAVGGVSRPLRVLLLSSLYPNVVQPTFGVFVETRLRELMRRHPVEACVVAPVPWFPSTHPRFGRYARMASVPQRERRHGVTVLHPRYPLLPKVGLATAPLAMAAGCIGTLRSLQQQGFNFDVIDAHFYHPDGAAAALLGRWFRRPVAVTARGSDINLNGGFAVPAATIRWTGRQVGASIGVSAALVQAMAGLGVPTDRLHVLRNGVDTERFALLDPADCRRQLGLGRGPVLLAVANLVELKGHALMVAALPQVLAEHPDAQLVLVGEGDQRAALEAQVQALGLQDSVLFVGAVPNEALAPWYGAADVLLLASSREGWPNVLLEAMACGTPVVTTAVGGTPEIVTDPAVGTLLPSRDSVSIAQAVLHRLAAPANREAVRSYAQGFGWAATSLAQYELLQGLAVAFRERLSA